MANISLTEPLLQGDLYPAMVDFTDLRDDNAGSELQQMRMIIVRYLETKLGCESVQLPEMFEDIVRHYPFLGDQEEEFANALNTLIADDLVEMRDGENLHINKVAHKVASRHMANR